MKAAANNHSETPHDLNGAAPAPVGGGPPRPPDAASAAVDDPPPPANGPGTAAKGSPPVHHDQPHAAPPAKRRPKWLLPAVVAAGLAIAAWFLVPMVDTAMNTVSTDDAYVNGHVTFVAPRVSGQVAKVQVDDNDRVKKGDRCSSSFDKEPVPGAGQSDSLRTPSSPAEAKTWPWPSPRPDPWRPRRAASAGSSKVPSKTSTPRSPNCGPWRPP